MLSLPMDGQRKKGHRLLELPIKGLHTAGQADLFEAANSAKHPQEGPVSLRVLSPVMLAQSSDPVMFLDVRFGDDREEVWWCHQL